MRPVSHAACLQPHTGERYAPFLRWLSPYRYASDVVDLLASFHFDRVRRISVGSQESRNEGQSRDFEALKRTSKDRHGSVSPSNASKRMRQARTENESEIAPLDTRRTFHARAEPSKHPSQGGSFHQMEGIAGSKHQRCDAMDVSKVKRTFSALRRRAVRTHEQRSRRRTKPLGRSFLVSGRVRVQASPTWRGVLGVRDPCDTVRLSERLDDRPRPPSMTGKRP